MPHTLLYGGTFDPIHHGHLITCQAARELLHADRVLFIPAGVSPHKTARAPVASAEHRVKMLQLAIAPTPQFAIDTRELSRPGPSYTADTLDELQRENPVDTFTLLIGADQLPKFHTWHRVQDLLATDRNRNIAILPRSAEPALNATAALAELSQHLGQPIAARLSQSLLATPRIDISATEIRDRLRHHLPIDYLVPPSVAAYIREHAVYHAR